ncbi:hypothetical protein AX774_g7907, partial [Zancudomyces culisetae]
MDTASKYTKNNRENPDSRRTSRRDRSVSKSPVRGDASRKRTRTHSRSRSREREDSSKRARRSSRERYRESRSGRDRKRTERSYSPDIPGSTKENHMTKKNMNQRYYSQ